MAWLPPFSKTANIQIRRVLKRKKNNRPLVIFRSALPLSVISMKATSWSDLPTSVLHFCSVEIAFMSVSKLRLSASMSHSPTALFIHELSFSLSACLHSFTIDCLSSHSADECTRGVSHIDNMHINANSFDVTKWRSFCNHSHLCSSFPLDNSSTS